MEASKEQLPLVSVYPQMATIGRVRKLKVRSGPERDEGDKTKQTPQILPLICGYEMYFKGPVFAFSF